jgi:hypothetical protein
MPTGEVEASDELESLWQIVRKTPIQLASFRNGEAWHTPETFATIERLGFRCDSTVIPGRKGGGISPADWTAAPNFPYYPASENLCREGPERRLLEVPLNGWQTQADYDAHPRIRYMNPGVHEKVFSDALNRWRVQLSRTALPLNVWTLVLHPDELMAASKPDALYARSVEACCRNLRKITECVSESGHSFEFVTMAVAAERWRVSQGTRFPNGEPILRKECSSLTSV